MTDQLHTAYLNVLMERYKQGDASALHDLFLRCQVRLQTLARSMLRQYPSVRAYEETCDIVHIAASTLFRALKELDVPSTRDFYALAATHMRRRLIELAKHYSNPIRSAQSLEGNEDSSTGSTPEPVAPHDSDLDTWCEFHEAVQKMPSELREVFSLRFYHGWDNASIAELMGISTKTVTNRWNLAMSTLVVQLQGQLPPIASSDEK
jgi:RNA polymerase sigma-70 factor (ECF subfamily)